MADDVAGRISRQTLREADLPTMFEIQLDDTAQHLAAFTDETARSRDAYLEEFRQILGNEAGINGVDLHAVRLRVGVRRVPTPLIPRSDCPA